MAFVLRSFEVRAVREVGEGEGGGRKFSVVSEFERVSRREERACDCQCVMQKLVFEMNNLGEVRRVDGVAQLTYFFFEF